MSQIEIKNLTFSYDGSYKNVFSNVNLNIDSDWKLGLIGKNGAGKSTFLNILLGKLKYSGKIVKNVDFEYFPPKVLDEDLTVEEIIKSLSNVDEEWKIRKELNLIGMSEEDIYKTYRYLSGGEKVKVMLISLFLKENEFLLIDEPTNHLDIETKKEVEKYLKQKKSYIIVSHDRKLLDSVCDHIMAINNETIDVESGNYSSWKENKDRRDNFEINKNEKIIKDVKRLEKSQTQKEVWSFRVEKTKIGNKIDKGYIGHKSQKMMKRAKVLESRIDNEMEEKKKLLKDVDEVEELKIVPLPFNKSKIIYAKDLQIKYNGKFIFEKLNFEINENDRVALIGKNGSGKTSLIKLIMGEKVEYNGEINVSNGLKISYVNQDTSSLKGSVKDYIEKYKDLDKSVFYAMLNKLGVPFSELDKDMISFSEGQRKKVLIARSISESANLYIWDEPLNYIDIASREQIEKMILKYEPTMIFVEHDETFCNKIATKKIVIKKE